VPKSALNPTTFPLSSQVHTQFAIDTTSLAPLDTSSQPWGVQKKTETENQIEKPKYQTEKLIN